MLNELRALTTVILACIVFGCFIWIGSQQAEASDLADSTADWHARIAAVKAEHNARLVARYEPALAACANGVGFEIGNTFVQCFPVMITR